MDRGERQELLNRLVRDAERIAARFGLTYRGIVAEHPRVRSRYGACTADGLIKIRLNHASTGRPLRYSSLVDTLCHELAHLRHFDHSAEFKAFFLRLLGCARQQGIYRPGRPRHAERALAVGQASRPAAASAALPRRNGVAVFDHGDACHLWRQAPPPWERFGRATSCAPTPAPAAEPSPGAGGDGAEAAGQSHGAPPPARRQKRPVQLSLF